MSTSAPPSHAGRRWPWVVGAVLLAIVVGVGVCEASGWPFLVAPLQHWLSNALDRRVAFGPAANGSDGVRIGLLGSVRVQAPSIEIGAPSWSKAPHMVLARNARLKLRYSDLWRAYRGGSLRIAELRADQLDARIERLADGRASWQFGAPKPADPSHPARLPSFDDLRVGDGTLLLRDAVLDADLDARFSLTDRSGAAASSATASQPGVAPQVGAASRVAAASQASAPPGSSGPAGNMPAPGLQLHANGKYQQLPVKIELATTDVLQLAGPDAANVTQPVTLDATIGRAHVRFGGVVSDVLHLAGLRGRFDVAGASLAAIGDSLGVTLPTTGPFQTHGFVAKEGDLWKAVFDEATIGQSRLSGAFTFDRGQPVPMLAGRLNGSPLLLVDLGPAVGAPPRSSPSAATAATKEAVSEAKAANAAKAARNRRKVLPDRRFDLPALRAMNANVLIDITDLDLGTKVLEPLKPLRTHLRLQGGVLTLSNLDARTADGRLSGSLQLDGRNPRAIWSADLQLLGVHLDRWLHLARRGDAPPYISGQIDGQAKVSGGGRSTAEILGSLNGAVRFHLRNATISHLVVEAAGIDFAQAVGVLFKGDDSLAINCNVADFVVANGVARPRIFVLDTRDTTIWIDGSVSLQSETLDLTTIVSPKDFSPLALRTPIHVKGTFSAPSVSLEKGKVGAKVGAAALLSLINPLAAIIPFIDTGASDDAKREAAQCADFVKRSNPAKLPPAGSAAK